MKLAKGKSSTTIVVVIVVAVLLAAIAGWYFFILKGDTVKERTMVEISKDGKKVAEISDVEYNYKLINIMQQFQQAYGITDQTQVQQFWTTPVEGVTQLDQVKNFALEQMKFEKVEYLKAIENGTKLSSQEKQDLENSFDSVKKQFEDAGEDLEEYLNGALGISFKMYKEYAEQGEIASKFSNLQINNVLVTDTEIQEYYDANIDKYFSVKVRHILIINTDAEGNKLEGDALQEKKDLADEVLAKINAGEDMDALVDEYSEDPGAAENYGYYDVTEDASYLPEFKTWALESQVGDTAIVETDAGYHIMKTYTVSTFEDVKLQVKKNIQTNKYAEVIQGWLDEYTIEVFDAVYEEVNPLSA